MRLIRSLVVAAAVAGALAVPASAGPGPSVHGGGSADDMTRFGLAISGGTGHFECLMPAVMTVQATVAGVDWANPTSARFHGVAAVNLAANNPFSLPAGPMVRGAPFYAIVTPGGPGSAAVDLEILGMSFTGQVEHGQITIEP
ncbi:MAG: hypothetical protein E6G02_02685 [Actinobacteria bacterium]|nr:MAG: hypothetical protein E6G02_02685 [Actinomycetota bacterium]